MALVEAERRGAILLVRMDNPPVNALGYALRDTLMATLRAAEEDEEICMVVLAGTPRFFSAGADITEFNQPMRSPSLREVIAALDEMTKTTVAAIQGVALGGGCELALGCHYRVAWPGARLGLPEVKLGILPGAGGTQRLPRVVGAQAALGMIVSGDPIAAKRAEQIGLVDRLVDEAQLAEEAIAFARAADGPRRTGERTVTAEPGVFETFAAENARRIKGLDAPLACIEAVKAATELPLAEGLERERALFMRLVRGDQSKAMRHVFFAERAAAKIDGLPKDTALRPVAKVGVIGAGTMGGGISMNFLSAGIPVTIVEMAQDALDRGTGTMRKNYEATAAKGRLKPEQVEQAMGLLSSTLDFAGLADCDLIIEAVYENMDVKKEIFTRLDRIAKPGAMLASNTSYLSIDEIAAVTSRPQDVLGLHFFSPANVMQLVEVVRGAKTAPDALATAMALARKIRKVPVVAGVCYGFIGNRMLIPRQGQANALLLEGATPEQVDRVHTAFGMPMGPFQMADLAGVDIGWHRDPSRIESLQDALCAEHRWGQKTKAGFYDYDEKRRPTPSPVTAGIIDKFRQQAGTEQRQITDEEITVRTLYTMVNEGAKILEEGIAQRASDIDVVWVYGYGWPRHTGGPMFWADTIGVKTVLDGLERYRDRLGEDFEVSPLLRRHAEAGTTFNG